MMRRLRDLAAGLTALAVGYAFMHVVQGAQQTPIGPTDNIVVCSDNATGLHAR